MEDNISKKPAGVIHSSEVKQDIHGTEEMTRWVHKHRVAAKWLVRILALGVASFSYYLRKQEKEIDQEEKSKK